MKEQWISVKDQLPIIPEGQNGVGVITALLDEHEALYRISEYGPDADLSPCYYISTDTCFTKNGWKDYDEQGGVLNFFTLTHWMYKPQAPDVPLSLKQELLLAVDVVNDDTWES